VLVLGSVFAFISFCSAGQIDSPYKGGFDQEQAINVNETAPLNMSQQDSYSSTIPSHTYHGTAGKATHLPIFRFFLYLNAYGKPSAFIRPSILLLSIRISVLVF
jgi:hypothetical protein